MSIAWDFSVLDVNVNHVAICMIAKLLWEELFI